MRSMKKLSYFLIILSALIFGGGDAYAQNIFKMDLVRTSQRFSIWVQKQGENFEQAMKEIAESQFATFIGKGIDAAKKGLKFVQDKMQEAKDLYGKAKQKIDDEKNSTAYKVAMLSKQLATETIVLNTIKQQRDAEKATLESEAELSIMSLNEKVAIAKENFEVGMEVLRGEFNELKTDAEKEVKQKEIDAYEKDSKAGIRALDEEISNIEEAKKEQIKGIDFNFALAIASQSAIIADIGMEIAELTSQKKKEDGEVEEDPDKLIEEAVNDFSYKEGEVITLEVREKKEKSRKRKRETISLSTSSYSVNLIAKTADKIEEEEQSSSVSETVNGKSEALQTAIEQTVVQLDTLYEHLLLELKALEMETANIMAENKEYKAGKVKAAIDICNYKMKKDGNLLDTLKNAKNKIEEGVNKAKDAVDKVSNAVNEAVDVATDVVATATAVVGAVEGVKSMVSGGSVDKDTITGLTGM